MQPHGLQHIRLLCPLLSPRVCSNSCPLSRWCYLTISSSAASFPFCFQSFPVSGSFPKSWLFASDGWSIGASTSASVQFSCSFVSNSFRPHGLQHTRPACPSPITEVYLNSCPLSRWCHPSTSSSVIPFSSRLQSFPASGSSNDSVLRITWPKYWSFNFNISPSNKHLGLISFRMDWS